MAERKIIFLDTTFVMPFFQIQINIKNFDKNIFEKILRKFQLIILSEISLIEILFKLTKMYTKKKISDNIFNIFKENLSILREDRKIKIKTITSTDINNYLYFLKLKYKLNPIDMLILAQGIEADIILTEDKNILKISEEKSFKEKYKAKILNWSKLTQLYYTS